MLVRVSTLVHKVGNVSFSIDTQLSEVQRAVETQSKLVTHCMPGANHSGARIGLDFSAGVNDAMGPVRSMWMVISISLVVDLGRWSSGWAST